MDDSNHPDACRAAVSPHRDPFGKVGPFARNRVYRLDCVEALRRLPDASVDLAIADPPYNLSKGGKWSWDNSAPLPGFGGDWNKVMASWDDMPMADYVSFTLAWLRQLRRVVRPTGSLWVHGTYHNAGILNFCMQLLGIEIINEVVWYKRNSFPNLSGRRLTASHETILWAHTGPGTRRGNDRQYRFNYDASKEMECPEDQLKLPGKQMRTVWDIPNNKAKDELAHGKHPTQKPVRLLRRMLEISAVPGCTVLVPFAGAGSECVAAAEFGAHFVGFEIEDEYFAICQKRLGLAPATVPPPAPDAKQDAEKKRTKTTPSPNIPSLLKWTGSKRSQAGRIVDLFPEYATYFEPFLGGGAVLYLAHRGSAVAGDAYAPLIDFWRIVQSDPRSLVEDYRTQWRLLQDELAELNGARPPARSGLPRYFYQVRDRFNASQSPYDLNFLMRTCVNGIARFNSDGAFNNSFHLSRRGMTPERFERTVFAWHQRLRGVTFLRGDYESTLAEATSSDFVYFDPPYAGNSQRYVQDLDLPRFYRVLDRLNQHGVKWALSFDGRRGGHDLTEDVPRSLYRRHLYLPSGNSAVHKVLNGPLEPVHESLYLNY